MYHACFKAPEKAVELWWAVEHWSGTMSEPLREMPARLWGRPWGYENDKQCHRIFSLTPYFAYNTCFERYKKGLLKRTHKKRNGQRVPFLGANPCPSPPKTQIIRYHIHISTGTLEIWYRNLPLWWETINTVELRIGAYDTPAGADLLQAYSKSENKWQMMSYWGR